MYFCSGSLEKAMSHTEPSPRVSGAMIFSFTKVPFFRKTWIRSLTRSQTYTWPSVDGSAQWTGVRKNLSGGLAGSYGGSDVSDGTFPYAPQNRLTAPVAMSSTATRLLR